MTPGSTGRIPPVPSKQSRRMDEGKCPCSSCVNAESSRTFLETGILPLSTFIVCPDCGNKRCPKASRHDYLCTQSNALGQVGTLQSRDETLEQENTRLHKEVEDWIGMYRIAVSRADAAEASNAKMLETLSWVINDVQNWCDAVAVDSSWDEWDDCYKSFAYGGLDKARAAIQSASQLYKVNNHDKETSFQENQG